MPNEPLQSGTKLIVRVLQGLVRERTYTDHTDLVEDLKCRCARLNIPYDSTRVYAALDRLERGGRTPIIAPPRPRRLVERPPEPEVISKPEAERLARELLARCRTRGAA